MKQAIIDIGSNSMRLTLYETSKDDFKILFREKIMAALASYVEDGRLNDEGIEIACRGLLNFISTLQTLKIEQVNVFATASLRNISNTEHALAVIKASSDIDVEVLSGEDEALLGYIGAIRQLQLKDGVFVDIGGASSEIVTFKDGGPIDFTSFPIGSLSLYKKCVKRILPGDGSLKRIKQEINKTIVIDEDEKSIEPLIVSVGGTARAVLKLAKKYYKLKDDCTSISVEQLDGLCTFLTSGKKEACDLILKLEAERIHTIVPGLLILQHVFHTFEAKKLVVSKYGVREGYLCQRILKNNTNIPKAEN